MTAISKTTILLFVLLAMAACSKSGNTDTQAPAASRAAVPVVAELLRFERERVRIEAVGTSRARLSADLFSPTSGEVVAVNFEPGQAVKAGDVLVQLDAEKEKLAVRLAELHLEEAELLYDRYERSAGSGAVLPTALDAARLAAESASVELERSRIALDDRSITAVFNGYVGSSEADPGDRVDTSTLITTLDDRGSLFVSFAVPEAFIGELAVNDEVQMRTWNEGSGDISGVIIDIGSRIDPTNRTFTVRARVGNADDRLRPGMSFRVRIDVQGKMYAVISETGLQWGADGAYVWAVIDGSATRVPVRVVQRREGQILVDSELKDGAIIVVEGTQNMRDGIAVDHGVPRVAASGGSLSVPD